jgi:hypothetical protein
MKIYIRAFIHQQFLVIQHNSKTGVKIIDCHHNKFKAKFSDLQKVRACLDSRNYGLSFCNAIWNLFSKQICAKDHISSNLNQYLIIFRICIYLILAEKIDKGESYLSDREHGGKLMRSGY